MQVIWKEIQYRGSLQILPGKLIPGKKPGRGKHRTAGLEWHPLTPQKYERMKRNEAYDLKYLPVRD